jgi:hypothetical protein
MQYHLAQASLDSAPDVSLRSTRNPRARHRPGSTNPLRDLQVPGSGFRLVDLRWIRIPYAADYPLMPELAEVEQWDSGFGRR